MGQLGQILNPFSMLMGGGGGGYSQPQQQPIILTAPPPQQPAFDWGPLMEMMRPQEQPTTDWGAIFEGMNQDQGGAKDQQASASVPPTNVSPVLTNDKAGGGVAPSPGLPVPDPTAPGTPEQEEEKKTANNKGGMSVGLPT